ncbi:MAG: adenosylcobalamin-dependent ribonucleoside-diphosphate reductase [Candidatus Micrarchaeota archaeon]|nr:adenosylcobalamin-dependent ribonucleoside-diphosphate reductase [Candidatus Micrarchaeota archaeon]
MITMEGETATGATAGKEAVISIPTETLDFFKEDEIRARVFYEKYALKESDGSIMEKTPEDMWNRLAYELSSVEVTPEKRKEWEEKFRWLLGDFRFVPGGRIMFGAGQKRKSTLLNCYVIPVKRDSLEAIFDWCKEAARTYSYGGGVGTDISVLRPRGSPVNNSAVKSTGAVSFMNIMSETTHTIGQSGRRGALMITMSVDHPDIFDFITVKRNIKSVRYANISVRVTDEFMKAVEADKDFTLRYDNEVVGKIERKVRAKDLWIELVQSARDWAEPGLIFWDTVKRYSPSEYNGMSVIGTNPCSEQPLQPYGACDLGSINLSAFVTDAFTDKAAMDWKLLEKTVRYAVRFLDNVLDYNMEKHALPEQTQACKDSRRIGLGVTGLADMFAKLKIKYDSDQALAFADSLFNNIKRTSYDESSEIAREKGSFLMFDKEKHLSMAFVKGLDADTQEKIAEYGLRNVAILTVPPVGSGAVLSGTSSGIEPIFAFSYTRRSESLSQEYFKVYHPLVSEFMASSGITDEKELPEYFVPAHRIVPEFRVKMQGVIQRHIDSAISSTVNLASSASVEEVGKIYFQAWKAGCKGITVYREGSREGILITDEKQKEAESRAVPAKQQQEWRRPQMMVGKTIRLEVPQGTLYLTANFDPDKIREVFIELGKAGSEEKSYCEAIGRLISKYLQGGGDANEVISSLKGIRSNAVMWDHGLKLYSVPDAIGKALEMATGQANLNKKLEVTLAADAPPAALSSKEEYSPMKHSGSVAGGRDAPPMGLCPKCSEKSLVNENGCITCHSCGYTKCE